jgi:hypothetical protein
MLYTWPPTNSFMRGIDFLTRQDGRRRPGARMRSTQPVASPPLALVSSGGSGIVLFRAVGEPGRPPVGMLAWCWTRAPSCSRRCGAAASAASSVSLADVTDGAALPGGRHACGGARARADYRVGLAYGGRRYALRFSPTPPTWKSSAAWSAGPC